MYGYFGICCYSNAVFPLWTVLRGATERYSLVAQDHAQRLLCCPGNGVSSRFRIATCRRVCNRKPPTRLAATREKSPAGWGRTRVAATGAGAKHRSNQRRRRPRVWQEQVARSIGGTVDCAYIYYSSVLPRV